ncbi:MAG: baseplate J/gp47 family protein [Limnochordia bacterium]
MDWKALIRFKSFETLVSDALAALRAKGSRITDLNKGGVFRTLIELASQGVADIYKLILSVAPQGFVVYARGRWLDLHCEGMGITRFPATRTRGIVVFGRSKPGGNVVIRAGSIVKTGVGTSGREMRYFVEEETVLPEGALEVAVPVRAEFEGASFNVGPGYIDRLVTHIAGIETVYNPEGWIVEEGADEEDDESLRQRYLGRWDELATGATRAGYAAWARSVPGVVDVAVDDRFPRGQGTVDVIITGPAGAPSQELIDEVQAYLEARKPITDNVLVRGPETVTVDFDVALHLPRYQGEATTARDQALRVIQALFVQDDELDVPVLGIGESLYQARLIGLLMQIEHVQNVVIVSPAHDVILAPGELASLGTVNVTVERVNET